MPSTPKHVVSRDLAPEVVKGVVKGELPSPMNLRGLQRSHYLNGHTYNVSISMVYLVYFMLLLALPNALLSYAQVHLMLRHDSY